MLAPLRIVRLLPLATLLAALPAQDLGWNQWRGPRRDGLSPDTGLAPEWKKDGPPLLWRTDGLGAGFSSVSFAGKRLFTMGDVGHEARLFALSRADGKVLWSAPIGPAGGVRNAGPRATPSTDGERVYCLGQDGSLACVHAGRGKPIWHHHLVDDFGGHMMSRWGYSESPLLDGDLLVCTPGGDQGTVLALDKKTGKPKWRSKGLTDSASYASLVPIDLGGKHQYIVLTDKSVAGIAAEDGAVLWRADRPGRTAVCTTPVYHDGVVFVTSAYNVGCDAFRITAENGSFAVKKLYSGKQMQNHHGGVVLVGGHVYGIGRRHLKCIELTTGKVVWEDQCVGKGALIYADGHLLARSERDKGTLAWVEATPDGYREKGRFDPPGRTEEPAWSHPVIYGGRLYLRDQGTLLCFDLTAH